MVNEKVKIRCVMYYHYLKGTTAAATSREIISVFGTNSASERTVQKWYQRFRSGDTSCDDEQRSGRPQEIVDDDLQELVVSEPGLTCEDYAEKLSSSKETVRRALHRLGFVSKLQKWVPHELSTLNKLDRITICKQLSVRHQKTPFLDKMITGDEKWMYYKNATRSRQWSRPGQASGSVPRRALTKEKILLTVFWDSKGIIMYHFLGPNETMDSQVYVKLLDELDECLARKRPSYKNRGRVIFHQDNTRPHTAQITKNKLAELNYDVVPHPPYSPDLAPTDFHLFRSLQNYLRGTTFNGSKEVENEVVSFLDSRSPDFCKSGIFNLIDRWTEVIESDGDYIED